MEPSEASTPRSDPDVGIWQRLAAGDQAAFTTFFRAEASGVYDFVVRLVGDRHIAEDLTQATFVKVWEQARQVREPERARGWTYAIARNLATSHLRGRRPAESLDEIELASPARGPQSVAEGSETADLVWSAAASLEPRQYAVLDLAVRHDLSTPEVAQALGVRSAHAAVLVNRAKASLEGAVRALVVARRRDHCERLAELVPAGVRRLTPAQRVSIDHHMRRCDQCQAAAKRLLAPVEVFGALAPVVAPTRLLSTVPGVEIAPAGTAAGAQNSSSQAVMRAPRLRRKGVRQQPAAQEHTMSQTTTSPQLDRSHPPDSASTTSRPPVSTTSKPPVHPVRRLTSALPGGGGTAVGLVVAAAVAAAVLVATGNRDPRGGTDNPQRSYDYIAAKAAELNDDATAIISFVRDDVASDDYAGSLRGPVGTLWAGSGSDLDRALLLRALLGHTGRRANLVHGVTWGVRVSDGKGGFSYAGPAQPADATAKPATPAASEYDTVGLTVHTVAKDGRAKEEAIGTLRSADLSGHDIVASYERRNGRIVLVVTGPSGAMVTKADAATARSQSIEFTLTAPGQPAIHRERELFTRAYPDYASTFDPSNRYDITITTGWVPQYVLKHETAAVRRALQDSGKPDAWDATSHLAAYTFLTNSDANTEALVSQQHIAGHFVTPRITIVGSEADHADPGARVTSFDLRKNDLAVTGSAQLQASINTSHSLYDSSLESQVLQQVTGQSAMSAADSLAAAVTGQHSALPQRLLVVRQSLHRLLTDALPDGTTFTVYPSSATDFEVTFARAGAALLVRASGPVKSHSTSDRDVRWLLAGPTITDDAAIDRATTATETALADAAGLPIAWVAGYHFQQTPQFYWDVTNFVHGNPVQQLSITTVPNLEIKELGYYLGNDKSQRGKLTSNDLSTIDISDADLNNARVVQGWFEPQETSDGNTISMLSRASFAQLRANGSTVVRFHLVDGSLSDPVRLYDIGPGAWPVRINGKMTDLSVRYLNGDYVKNNSPVPTNPGSGPEIIDPNDVAGGAINKFAVLDDSRYPFNPYLFVGGNNQTDVPGAVTDADTGAAILGASVNVVEPGSSTVTWADGSFSLPAFNKEFANFEVQVSAPGYLPLDTTVNFAKPANLPLKLQLQPDPAARPKDGTWVSHDDVDSTLAGLTLSARSVALIRQSVASPDVSVLVPGQTATDPFGAIDTWLEVNTRTGEMYAMFPDGLYGASTVHDILGNASDTIGGWAGKGGTYARDKINEWLDKNTDNPFDFEKAKGDVPIAFFAGHVAGWYYFAAGALSGVSANISNPKLTLCQLHAIAVRTAVALVKGQWWEGPANWGLGKALEYKYNPPFTPTLNAKVNELSFRAGALSAIALLAMKTQVEWGLGGQSC